MSLTSIANGVAHTLEEVSDPVFQEKMMGDGYFIDPSDGHIYSPVDGTITTVFPTKHAIGITTTNGLDVLIHMGIDTVNLDGKPFDVKVTQGQKVKQGDLLAMVDLEQIKEAKKETSMIVILTNMDDIDTFVLTKTGTVTHTDHLLNVKMT